MSELSLPGLCLVSGQGPGEEYQIPCRLLRVLARNDDRWGESDQQDAQELLHSMLDYLQTDMANGKPPRLGLRRGSVGLSESLQARTTAHPGVQGPHCLQSIRELRNSVEFRNPLFWRNFFVLCSLTAMYCALHDASAL